VNRVDKARVEAAFTRGAAAYDARAEVQARVRRRALALARLAAPRAATALDVGCGTGRLLADLMAERPGLRAAGVDLARGMCRAAALQVPAASLAVGDAEALPVRGGAFDLVLSTSTLQWLPRLEPAVAELARAARPGGGRVVLALFGERTLQELKAAWREAAAHQAADRTHRFASAEEVARAVRAAGLLLDRLEEEEHLERHPDARAVLRSLKAIGAQSAAPGAAGLAGRRVTLDALRRYDERHGGPDGVPVTWHVVYAVASR
jgi:malonyl-CoA O-methyltransferase